MFVSEIALKGLTYFLFAGVYSMLATKNIPVGSFKTMPLQVPGFTSPPSNHRWIWETLFQTYFWELAMKVQRSLLCTYVYHFLTCFGKI